MFDELLKYGLTVCNEDLRALCMTGNGCPVSITEEEFRFITTFVAANGYTNGYELATGFGISTCAIGLGLKANGGKIISVDAYIEEKSGSWDNYQDKKKTHTDSKGFKMASTLVKHFNLENEVELQVGWSPDDIPEILEGYTIDFAFIDGAHFDQNVLDDINVIRPNLITPFTVMLHDIKAFSKGTLDTISGWLGTEIQYPRLSKTWGIGYYRKDSV